MAEGILEGIRVMEWGHFVSGPWAARLLGDMGAEVVKLEPPGLGDQARRVGPFPGDVPHPETSGLHLFLNCNKRGITLDPATAQGKHIFQQLVRETDILVENHRPSEVEALGFTYERLREANPRLIMVSISPFGDRTVPRVHWQRARPFRWAASATPALRGTDHGAAATEGTRLSGLW
jgi:crotonobetainyl-CoA:carnitine CoA-transferase CaiB-like acyl-CoA transferase